MEKFEFPVYKYISSSEVLGLLIPLSLLMSYCSTAVLQDGCTPCPVSEDFIIHENGHCCRKVSCGINFTVSECQVNCSNDTCVACPAGSFLLDPTTSETATKCIKPVCIKNVTRPSKVKATSINLQACPEYCQCDLRYNFCGTDPCNCKKGTCLSNEILQQNCGCEPKSNSPPKPIPPKDTPVANFTTTMPRTNVSVTSASPVDTSTPRDNRSTTKSTAITTMEPDSHSNQGNGDVKVYVPVLVGIACLVIGVAVGFICRNKCKQDGQRSDKTVKFHKQSSNGSQIGIDISGLPPGQPSSNTSESQPLMGGEEIGNQSGTTGSQGQSPSDDSGNGDTTQDSGKGNQSGATGSGTQRQSLSDDSKSRGNGDTSRDSGKGNQSGATEGRAQGQSPSDNNESHGNSSGTPQDSGKESGSRTGGNNE